MTSATDTRYVGRGVSRRESGVANPFEDGLAEMAVGLMPGIERELLFRLFSRVAGDEIEPAGPAAAEQPADLRQVCFEVLVERRQGVRVAGFRIRRNGLGDPRSQLREHSLGVGFERLCDTGDHAGGSKPGKGVRQGTGFDSTH